MNYRLLRIDISGKLDAVSIVDAADDQTAVARGRNFGCNRIVEVWCGAAAKSLLHGQRQAAAR